MILRLLYLLHPAKSILTITLAVLYCAEGYSQFSFGVKAGMNLSRMITKTDTSGWDAYSVSPSFHLGTYGMLRASEKIAFGADLLISDKGFRIKNDGFSGASHLLYVNVPVYFDFRISNKLSLHAGPEIGILAMAWGKHKDYLKALYSNDFDFGVIGGLRYDVSSKLGFTFRFEQGLSNVVGKNATALQYNIGSGDPVIEGQNLRERGVVHRNQTIQLTVNFTFL